MNVADFNIADLPGNSKAFDWLEVAGRADGGVWQLPLLYVTGQASGPTLVVIAGVHGDEYEGVETIPRVYQQVNPADIRGRLVMVPVCNVPAYEVGTRSSPIDGLNLARVLPGDREGSITQRIGYWVTEKLMLPADFFIDIHSGGVALNIPTSIYYFHTDNEIGRHTQRAALAFGAPVVVGNTNPAQAIYGCSFRTAWDRQIPAMFTEAPGAGRVRPEDSDCFTTGVLNVMKYLGMMAGDPTPQPMTHHLISDDQPGGSCTATVAGYFRPDVRIMDAVQVGQRLGAILDFSGAALQECIAGRDGFITMLRGTPRVHVGDAILSITGGAKVS